MALRTRMTRSTRDEMVAGVLGGVSEYFGLDSSKVRLAFVVASLISAGFPGIVLYLMLWYVIPEGEQRSMY
ncbi:MAG: PspC domain-containing protein [Gemmatimonadaceae bacterium]